MILMRASTERSSKPQVGLPKPPNLGRFWLAKKKKRTIEMASANQAYREAVNSPAGRRAAATAKSTVESARSMGEEIADVAGDVSAMASKQYSRAQDMAVEAFDDAHAAMKRNPLMAVAIALGLGFVVGVFTRARR